MVEEEDQERIPDKPPRDSKMQKFKVLCCSCCRKRENIVAEKPKSQERPPPVDTMEEEEATPEPPVADPDLKLFVSEADVKRRYSDSSRQIARAHKSLIETRDVRDKRSSSLDDVTLERKKKKRTSIVMEKAKRSAEAPPSREEAAAMLARALVDRILAELREKENLRPVGSRTSAAW